MLARHRRVGCPRLRALLAPLLALALASCASPPPPPQQPAAAVPLPPPPPPPATPTVLRANWAFHATESMCNAVASSRAASLTIVVRPEGMVRLELSLPRPPPARPTAHFAGPAGQWAVAGAASNHGQAVFLLPRNEQSLGRLLILLSGGTLALDGAEPALPVLALPESGPAGREWFDCAKRSVTGA